MNIWLVLASLCDNLFVVILEFMFWSYEPTSHLSTAVYAEEHL